MTTTEKKIINWLKAQLKKTGTRGLLCGISGGVDSAVVSCLIKKAAGKNHICLILPCNSNPKDIKDAGFLAKKFKLKTKTVHLCTIYESLLKLLPPAGLIAKANLKARLRMLTLYYFANKLNYLVVGTGNKSECLMGYFTKFGDGAVDLLPLGNILKTDVKKLAGNLGVPEKILNKAPSASLWKGQTDEGEMGIKYVELDAILRALERQRRPRAPKALVEKVRKKIKDTEHKRRLAEVFK